MIRRRISKLIASGLALCIILQISACGTILYPERKGQIDGRIDPHVAILDGIGLLLFLVPGVIAFAVDFSNGTIYLPGTRTSSIKDASEMNVVNFDNTLGVDDLEIILERELGVEIELDSPEAYSRRLYSLNDIESRLYLNKNLTVATNTPHPRTLYYE